MSVTPQIHDQEKVGASSTPPLQHDADGDNNCSKRTITGLPWFVVNVAVLTATFLYALDNTVTANVRPAIIETFGNRVDMLPWLSVAYPMGEVGANPLW